MIELATLGFGLSVMAAVTLLVVAARRRPAATLHRTADGAGVITLRWPYALLALRRTLAVTAEELRAATTDPPARLPPHGPRRLGTHVPRLLLAGRFSGTAKGNGNGKPQLWAASRRRPVLIVDRPHEQLIVEVDAAALAAGAAADVQPALSPA